MNDRDIYMNAPEGASPEELATYLAAACGDDAELRARVDALLAAGDEAGEDFLATRQAAEGNGVPPTPAIEGDGLVVGKYKLLQAIGEGGFGVVYMAEQQKPVKRRVAFKLIKPGMDSKQVVARFEAERQALAMMDHPNIAKVLDAGATETGRPFFVMELVKGIPITKFCDEQNLSTEERLELYIDVCRAVQHAHQKGIIHRDLKPSNVMVTMHDDKAVPKVIDFGVAKATQTDLTDKTLYTRYEQFIGTPAYMSPEQAQLSGLDIDTRSDIYALGVLLYELLTGKTPFDSGELLSAGYDEIRRIIREEEPPKPSTRVGTMEDAELTDLAKHRKSEPQKLRSLIRGDLDWIVMKALEKDRTRRYDTANGLAMDVLRHLRDEPVTAAAPSAAYRMHKYVRKHRAMLGTVATIAAVLVAGIVVSTLAWRKAARSSSEEAAAKELFKSQLETTELLQAETAVSDRKSIFSLVDPIPLADNPGLGIANLVRYLRENPTSHVAAERLMAALRQRAFPTPLLEPFDDAHGAWFSADGARIVTTDIFSGEVRIRDAITGDLHRVIKPGFPVWFAQFSPDPSQSLLLTLEAAVTSNRCQVRVWDWMTGEPVGKPLQHSNAIPFARFSPQGDRILTGDDSGVARIWDARTGEPLHGFGYKGGASAGDWSPDGRRVVIEGGESETYVWDAETGEKISAVMRHGIGGGWSVRFGPHGRRVVTASTDGTARVWDATTGKPIGEAMRHGDRVQEAVFSPDGALVATASWDQTARIWDAETGRPVTAPLKEQAQLWTVRFSPDGQQLLTGAGDGNAQLWDVSTGRPIGPPMRHEGSAHAVSFDPRDGKRILVAGWSGRAKLWALRPSQPQSQVFRHKEAPGWSEGGSLVEGADFSPDGKQLATVAGESRVRVWDVRTGQEVVRVSHNAPNGVRHSADGTRLLTTSITYGVRIWDPVTGRRISSPIEKDRVRHAEFSPVKNDDGHYPVVTASINQNCARVWNSETGEPVTPPLQHEAAVVHAAFSRDGSRVVTSSRNRLAKVWDAVSGKLICTLEGHTDTVVKPQFSPDGTRVVTGSLDRSVRIWNAETGKPIGDPMLHLGRVTYVEFSPDPEGQWVLSASLDKTARIWDGRTGAPLGIELRHASGVARAGFSPDGKRVVTASADGTGRVWDAATGAPVSEPLRHAGSVSFAAFSPDGTQVVTTGNDSAARLWEVPSAPEGTVPEWVPDWAEAVAGLRIVDGNAEAVSWKEQDTLRKFVESLPAHGFYNRSAKWFYEVPTQRTISPFSPLTVRDYVENRLRELTSESLVDAALVALDKSAEIGRLAKQIDGLEQTPTGEERTEAAVTVSEVEVAFLEQHLKPDDPAVYPARHNLAMRLHAAKRHERALEEWDVVVEGRQRVLGTDHQLTLSSMAQRVHTLQKLKRGEEAEQGLREIVKLSKAKYGPQSLESLRAQAELGKFYRERWANAEAIAVFQEVVEGRRGTLGPAHRDTLDGMHQLAWSLRQANRHAEALKVSQELIPEAEKVRGEHDDQTLYYQAGMAHSLAALGRVDEAVKIHREVLAVRKEVYGEGHFATAQAMLELAKTLGKQGEEGEALSYRQRAVELRSKFGGPDDPGTLDALTDLAHSYEALDDKEKAMETWKLVANRSRAALGADSRTANRLRNLARLHREQGRFEMAIPLLVEVVEMRAGTMGALHKGSIDAVRDLSQAYTGAGREAEARAAQIEYHRRRMETYPPGDPEHTTEKSAVAKLTWEDDISRWKEETRESVTAGKLEEARRHFAKVLMARVVHEASAGLQPREDVREVEELRLVVEQGGKVPPATILIPEGAAWRYLDGVSEFPGPSWIKPDFEDGHWKTGASELGFHSGDEPENATELESEDVNGEPRLAYYFRHRFPIRDAALLKSKRILVLRLLRDDGAVVYLNGREVARANMPSGKVWPNTRAVSAVAGEAEQLFHPIFLDPGVLKEGENTIAVEIHQSGPGSSDVGFNLELALRESPSSFFERWPESQGEAIQAMMEAPVGIADHLRTGPLGVEFFFDAKPALAIAKAADLSAMHWMVRARIQASFHRWQEVFEAAEKVCVSFIADREQMAPDEWERALRDTIAKVLAAPTGYREENWRQLLTKLLVLSSETFGPVVDPTEKLAAELVLAHGAAGSDKSEAQILGEALGEGDPIVLRLKLKKALAARDWQEAAKYNASLVAGAEDHRSGLEGFHLAALYLKLGRRADYDKLCKSLVARYAESEKLKEFERVAKALSAVGRAEDSSIPEAAVAMARAIPAGHGNQAWNGLVKGMAEFRVGNHDVARDLLAKVLVAAETMKDPFYRSACLALAHPFYAMSLHHCSKPQLAQDELRRAEEMMEELDPGKLVHDCFLAELALEEARVLIKGESGRAP